MIPAIPMQVMVEMAQRRRRFHHYLWHRVRNSWLRLTEGDRRAICDINPAWVPPRPALDATRRPMRDNDSGEDFLFMQRRMIEFADDILAGVGDPAYPRVEGWRRVPPPGDADYPVPEFPESELEEVKSAGYFEQVIAPWERQYNNPSYLSGVTLGQLGSDLEFTIYCTMHVRWAAPSLVGYRPSTVTKEEVGREWDEPAYDFLGDTYSNHVNPLFWKIHGWVDDRVENWRRVHGISGDIQWKGTWTGPEVRQGGADEARSGTSQISSAPGETFEDFWRIDQIISASAAGEFDGFFRPLSQRTRLTSHVPLKSSW